MVTRRVIRFVSLCCIIFHMVGNGEGCHATFPEGDITQTQATTTVTPSPCTVGTDPFGTFSPAPGSIVSDGTSVGLTCDPAYIASITPAVQNTCPDIAPLLQPFNGVTWGNWNPVIPAQTYPVPFSTTFPLICSGLTAVVVESGPFQYCQNSNNDAGNGERIMMTCTPSGEWSAKIILNGPGTLLDLIVNTPNAVKCNAFGPNLPVCLAPSGMAPVG
uniref:Sushi domain-containing protein n=1 Tax=Plectus sambesii TaxID=2011161 RepID=A0A914W304_9BILA